uniref:Transmembrane protein 135 N-terminal domain-containing protein n=1 Tax=Stomoxys calcitrans TaxID=35570 RepID=A0A1I8PGU6_STOCA
MVGMSKFFEEHAKHMSCQALGIHSEPCLEHFLRDMPKYVTSNFKYFAPLCLLPIVIDWRNLNKKKIRQRLEYYFHCSTMGVTIGYIINCLICLMRKGRFGIYHFVFIPSFIGSASVHFLASARVIEFFETSIFQCNIETFLLMKKFLISRLIFDSKILQTYIFMISSAIILQGKLLYNTKEFWILESNSQPKEIENQENCKCQLHPNMGCQQYLYQGVKKYFLLGLTLDILKSVISTVSAKRSSQSKRLDLIKNFQIRSLALFTVNVGVYRFTHCFLNKYIPGCNSLNHLLSSFLAGVCYTFYPQKQLFAFAVVHAIRTLWSIIQIENANTKNTFLRRLLHAPIGRILFPFGVAHLVHIDCLKPEYSSILGSAITNAITNKYPLTGRRQIELVKQKVEATYKNRNL